MRGSTTNEEDPVAYKFLSDDWIAAARKLREETSQQQATAPQPLKMNLVITEVPFGDGSVQAHIDTTSGQVQMDLGHLDDPEVTATLDYDTARAIMVDSDPQVGMQAFMAGKIKLQGDMTKALAMQSGTADPELTRKIQEITE
jgi:putative sterol carrier protein